MSGDLQRFFDAQSQTYDQALAELRAGRKRTHWMWFVLPQLAGRRRPALHRRERLDVGAHAVERDGGQSLCQSTGPATITWLPSCRPSTRCASRAHSTSASRSIPVGCPIS